MNAGVIVFGMIYKYNIAGLYPVNFIYAVNGSIGIANQAGADQISKPLNSNRSRKFHERSFGKSKPALTTSQNVEVSHPDKTIPKNANTVSFF
jgi:hypothetical protein